MRRELLASKKKETGLSLDPRTKLALLVTIALFVLSGGGGLLLNSLLLFWLLFH